MTIYSKMKGGSVIASGSQGCIFAPKLKRENRNGVTFAKTNQTSGNKISKVFFNKKTRNDEIALLANVHEKTRGIGVVGFASEFYDADALDKTNYDDLVHQGIAKGTACKEIKKALNENKKIYLFEQDKIDGDLRKLKDDGKTKPFSFFAPAYSALLTLNSQNIAHLDIALRNIFYNSENALLGDFGFSINFNKSKKDVDALIASFVTTFIGNNWQTIFDIEQCTPEAALAMFLYCNWKNKSEITTNIREATKDDTTKQEFYADFGCVKRMIPDSTGIFKYLDISGNTLYYEKYLEVVNAAETIDKEDDFRNYAITVILQSDKKIFIRIISKLLNIEQSKQEELVKQVWINDNFEAPFALDVAAQGAVAGASIPAAAAAAAAPDAHAAAAEPSPPNKAAADAGAGAAKPFNLEALMARFNALRRGGTRRRRQRRQIKRKTRRYRL